MAFERVPWVSPEEYLAAERKAETKSEYYGGGVFAMAGGSFDRSVIACNLAAAMRDALRGRPCRGATSDLRVAAGEEAYVYPDFTVVCGPPEFLPDGHSDTLLNPTIVFEVLSPSTERYDRGVRFAHYRRIPSLREYVLVSQEEARIERFERGSGGTWTFTETVGLEADMPLASIGAALSLREIYDGVTFPEPVAPPDTQGATPDPTANRPG